MFHSSSNDLCNLFRSDNVYKYAAFACLDSTYSAKGSESDSNMALSECIYCLPGYLKIFGGLYIKYKKICLDYLQIVCVNRFLEWITLLLFCTVGNGEIFSRKPP